MELNNKKILIISNEPWGNVWYSKHNWAFELSKNNTVYFINPPGKWNFKNLFQRKRFFDQQVYENLYIITYSNILPASGKFKFLFSINECLIAKQLRHFLYKQSVKDFIFWTFDPYRLVFPKKLKPMVSLFHCVDDYTNRTFNILSQQVDKIIIVSDQFNEKFNKFHKPILNIPHGISKEEFDVTGIENMNIPKEVEDSIFYIGNIDERLDYPIIEKLLQLNTEEKFCFVGPMNFKSNNTLAIELFHQNKYKNLFHFPPIHFKEAKYYICQSKVCLAPMNKAIHGNMINHHKLLQYFALGKPVLSPQLSEYCHAEKGLLYTYKGLEDVQLSFITAKKESDDKTMQDFRISYAKKHTYDTFIAKIAMFI